MKIYEHDGKKYVETGDYTVPRAKAKPGTVYNCELFGSENVSFVGANPGEWSYSNKILCLATPEEIAGAEKPAVHLTPASVGKAYRNGFTKVTVETRREGVYCVRGAYNHVGQAYWVKEDGKLADRCEAWAATFHNVKDKDLDLISEWDEKAEAGGLRPGDVGQRMPGATGARAGEAQAGANPANPAQPEILPTWTDGDVRAELAARTGVVHIDAAENRRRLVAVMAEDARPREVYRPDAPDRRTEHVPVAKAWVNPAMLGR